MLADSADLVDVGRVPGKGSEGGRGVVRFCFQHTAHALSERGCFVNGLRGGARGVWVEYDGEWAAGPDGKGE